MTSLPEHHRKTERDNKRDTYRIDWLVPFPIRGSGGHRTILNHARHLVSLGYSCHLHVRDRDYSQHSKLYSVEELRSLLLEYFEDTGAEIHAGWDDLSPCDLLFATMWQSAHPVHAFPRARRKAYFVQDFEAYFDPMGDGYLLAENSFKLGLQHITIGRWLTYIITSRYHGAAQYFDFHADEHIYFPAEEASEKLSVVCTYQPEKPRRCPHICRETLGIVKSRIPEAEIILYGADVDTSHLWFEHKNLRLISPQECGNLYRKASVGLCISASNPSRVPFEMMASGCPVVDVDRENNHFDYAEGTIALADSTPEALAEAIIHLLLDKEERMKRRQTSIAMMKERTSERTYGQFAHHVRTILEGEAPLHANVAPVENRLTSGVGSTNKIIQELQEELRVAKILLESGRYCLSKGFKIAGSKLIKPFLSRASS